MCWGIGTVTSQRQRMSKRKADDYDGHLCYSHTMEGPSMDYLSGDDAIMTKRARHSQNTVADASESSSTSWHSSAGQQISSGFVPRGWDTNQAAGYSLNSYPEGQASAGSGAPSSSSSWRVPDYGGFQVGSPSVTGQSDSMYTEEGMSQMVPTAPAFYIMEPPTLQRSNSLPNLRIAVSGPLNQLPSVIMGPPMARDRGLPTPASTLGAMVPYKAPQELVHDAVRYTIKEHLKNARREAEEDPAAPSQADDPTRPDEEKPNEGKPQANLGNPGHVTDVGGGATSGLARHLPVGPPQAVVPGDGAWSAVPQFVPQAPGPPSDAFLGGNFPGGVSQGLAGAWVPPGTVVAGPHGWAGQQEAGPVSQPDLDRVPSITMIDAED
eukprot:jgi/Botrbrau1/13746/Bobra.0056s0003.1